MCPLFGQASRILRAWSEGRRRAKGGGSSDPVHRECKAVDQYCREAVKSTEVAAYQKVAATGSPEKLKAWQQSQQEKLPKQKLQEKESTRKWLWSVKDSKVKGVVQGLQIPLMLKLMKQAGMKDVTVKFMDKVLTSGAEYNEDVDLTGLFPPVVKEKEYGNYEYRSPPVLKKLWDVDTTVLATEHVRVPDKCTGKIYEVTKQEVDTSTPGPLPFPTVLGPCRPPQVLPDDEVIPAFRFWVVQDVASGADEGRTVGDLIASGGNYRTRVRGKLELASLDDFVVMNQRVAELFIEAACGSQILFKQDMRKAFRQVPGDPNSRKWGTFGVRNPEMWLIELFQHLS